MSSVAENAISFITLGALRTMLSLSGQSLKHVVSSNICLFTGINNNKIYNMYHVPLQSGAVKDGVHNV